MILKTSYYLIRFLIDLLVANLLFRMLIFLHLLHPYTFSIVLLFCQPLYNILMLGLQTNLKEQQKYIQNSENQHQLTQSNTASPLQYQQFNKIAQVHAISNEIFLLQTEIHKKQQFLRQICYKIKTYYDFKAKQRLLQTRQQIIQNDLEQLLTYQDKIKKELRLLSQEEQIMKGKMIVQHNKITQTKEEYNNQIKRKQLLNKHLEDIKKGSENLRKKLKSLKQDYKKVSSVKSKIQENQFNAEVSKLYNLVENKKKKLKNILEQKQKCISPEQHSPLTSKLQSLRYQCEDDESLEKVHQQLFKQKKQLEERISFLKSVDIQSINEKKSFIQELSQKYSILQSQKQAHSAELQKYQEQLTAIQAEQKQAVGINKKMSKRKRSGKSKQIQVQNTISKIHMKQESQVKFYQKTVNRWKGKTLRKHCMVLMTVIGIIGLLFASVASLYS